MPPLWDEVDGSVFDPTLRSDFRLPEGGGLSGVEQPTMNRVEDTVYPASCRRRSRNGAQKYNVWRTELA
jgi:hypothetical protein